MAIVLWPISSWTVLRSTPAIVRRLAIEANAADGPTISDVSGAVGVSERTLEYGFRDWFGISPKRYLQTLRLNGVRRELRLASAATKIADVANRWGLWHLGQFAADYCKQFGELPSETLARNA